MLKITRLFIPAALVVLSACDSTDQTRDLGLNSHPLSELQAGLWIDPNGCDHWIIDDGVEGYMSPRLDRFGKPVCSGAGPAGTAIWDYKASNTVSDALF